MTKKTKAPSIIAGVGRTDTHFSNFEKHKEEESEIRLKNNGALGTLYTPDTLAKYDTDTHSRVIASTEEKDKQVDTHKGNEANPGENYLPHKTEEGGELQKGEHSTELLSTTELTQPDATFDNSTQEGVENEEDTQEEVEKSKWTTEASDVEIPLNEGTGVSSTEENDEDFMALVDVDGVDDESVEDALFASIDGTVNVIHASRIIATLTAEDAEELGIADIYEEDEFAEGVQAAMRAQGLRAGLQSSGFVLAKVNLRASKVLNSQVDKLVASKVAVATASNKQYQERFVQCLAVASVGSAVNFFKGDTNVLAQKLTAAFEQRGVAGAGKIVAAIFAKDGIGYANMIVSRAQTLEAMSPEVVNQMAEALDMVNEGQDLSALTTYEDEGNADFVDASEQTLLAPDEITAALAVPAQGTQRVNAHVQGVQKGVSPRVLAALQGNDPISFT